MSFIDKYKIEAHQGLCRGLCIVAKVQATFKSSRCRYASDAIVSSSHRLASTARIARVRNRIHPTCIARSEYPHCPSSSLCLVVYVESMSSSLCRVEYMSSRVYVESSLCRVYVESSLCRVESMLSRVYVQYSLCRAVYVEYSLCRVVYVDQSMSSRVMPACERCKKMATNTEYE